MQKVIFVTGVTRMREGFVCISGIDDKGQFVRPQIHYPERTGVKKEFLYVDGKVIIRPLVKVALEFLCPDPKSEFHTEDWEIDGGIPPRLISIPNEQEKQAILNQHADKSLESVLAEQSRSLIIVKPQDVPQIDVSTYQDRLRCHLSFYDEAGDFHNHLAVTDANWLAACKYLWLNDQENLKQRLIVALKNKEIFLRIGITRKWQGQVWRQVSGVFTIPDWLKGQCFANFGYDFNDEV